MNKTSSKTLTGIKYVYLVAFFVLLAGFFHPLINNSSFGDVTAGVIILFVGLAGAVLIYRSITSESKKLIFLPSGFALMGISLYYIYQFTGRA